MDNTLILKYKKFIEEKLLENKRRFEILYNSTKDEFKKSGIKRIILDITNDLKKLNEGNIDFSQLKKYNIKKEDLLKYEDNNSMEEVSEYRILRNVPVFPLNEFSNNEEINSIWSYLSFFGREYLGFLSSQNLKLDYSHAYMRDKFFGDYHSLVKDFENYGKILEQIVLSSENSSNKQYIERLTNLETKEYRELIIKTGKFLSDLMSFIEGILKAEKDGETVLLEPEKIVKIEGEFSNIDGATAEEALLDLYEFVKEFVDFIKIPKF
ncbi:MAG: hypothetical protein N2258_03775 [Brevinematales bacterium]|nr:hypothetical protein [Brevinematales bacterium]